MAKKISELNALLAAAIADDDQFVMVDKSGNETMRLDASEAILLFEYTHPNHSGDVTSVGDGAQTIGARKVNFAKMQAMSTARILGRLTAGSGDFEELTAVQLTAFINAATEALKGTVEKNTTAEMRAFTVDKFPDGASIIAAAAKQTLTDQATIAFDMALGWNAKVTLAGNRTLANPTNVKEGLMGTIELIQDGTGSRTLTLASNWKPVNGNAIELSTAAASVDVLDWTARSATEIDVALRTTA